VGLFKPMKTAVIEKYQCECGYTREIPRPSGRKRGKHHKKKMWCPHCCMETNFVKVGDV